MNIFTKPFFIFFASALAMATIIAIIPASHNNRPSYTPNEIFESPNLHQQFNNGKTFYTGKRAYVFPLNGSDADCNPPTLLWPIKIEIKPGTQDTSHRVSIATSPNFSKDRLITSPTLKWAIFRPDQQLPPGTYYWRFETTHKGLTERSNIFSFRITNNPKSDTLPSSQEVTQKLPTQRPRLLTCTMSPIELKERFEDSHFANFYIQAADSILNINNELLESPSKQAAETFKAGWKEQKITKDAVRDYGLNCAAACSRLLQAYLLTNQERYAQKAMQLAMEAAERSRPDDITLSFQNNFGNGGLILAMSLTLDTCYDLLSKEEKLKIIGAISLRIDSFFEREWTNNLETLLERGHAWQELLSNVLYGAIAVYGEVEKSKLWIRYIYELWNARFPVLGGEDGAWAAGPHYLSYNFESMLRIPSIFHSTCGVNLFTHSFYTEVAKYCAALPWLPGFNDALHNPDHRCFNTRPYIKTLHSLNPKPWTDWYLHNTKSPRTQKEILTRGLLDWNTMVLLRDLTSTSPHESTDLELNNFLFSSTGLAVFHSDRQNLSDNIMLSFKSSPWGPGGHAQREQNTFNIQKNAEPVFFRSGFRISAKDPHNKLYYSDSRSKNSILVNAHGQAEAQESTGYLSHFFHDQDISYVSGQAKYAYNAISEADLTDLEQKTFNTTRTGGQKVTDFTRHILFLKPHYVVIYDSLQASNQCHWELLLHSHQKSILQGNKLSLEGSNFSAHATIITQNDCKMTLSNDMTPPPENWREKESKDGELITYSRHWHFKAATTTASEAMKYLTIICIPPKGDQEQLVVISNGTYRFGTWEFTANINPQGKDSFQAIETKSQRTLLLNPKGELTFQNADTTEVISPLKIKKIGRGHW